MCLLACLKNYSHETVKLVSSGAVEVVADVAVKDVMKGKGGAHQIMMPSGPAPLQVTHPEGFFFISQPTTSHKYGTLPLTGSQSSMPISTFFFFYFLFSRYCGLSLNSQRYELLAVCRVLGRLSCVTEKCWCGIKTRL